VEPDAPDRSPPSSATSTSANGVSTSKRRSVRSGGPSGARPRSTEHGGRQGASSPPAPPCGGRTTRERQPQPASLGHLALLLGQTSGAVSPPLSDGAFALERPQSFGEGGVGDDDEDPLLGRRPRRRGDLPCRVVSEERDDVSTRPWVHPPVDLERHFEPLGHGSARRDGPPGDELRAAQDSSVGPEAAASDLLGRSEVSHAPAASIAPTTSRAALRLMPMRRSLLRRCSRPLVAARSPPSRARVRPDVDWEAARNPGDADCGARDPAGRHRLLVPDVRRSQSAGLTHGQRPSCSTRCSVHPWHLRARPCHECTLTERGRQHEARCSGGAGQSRSSCGGCKVRRGLISPPSSTTTASGPPVDTPSGRTTSFVVGDASAVQPSRPSVRRTRTSTS
jgi:hypothetical protein